MAKSKSPQPATSPVDMARRMLAALIDARDAATARRQEIDSEKRRLALRAHGEGDAQAQTELRQLNEKLLRMDLEAQDRLAAIEAAEANVEKSLRAEATVERVKAATRICARADDMKAHGEKLSKLAEEFVAEAQALRRATIEAGGYGLHYGEGIRRAADVMLQSAGFGPHTIAPGVRVTFGEIVGHWAENIRRRARSTIGGSGAKEAA